MDPNRAARKRVTALLKRFSEQLTSSLATGTAELWHKVERRLGHTPSDPAPRSDQPPPELRTPMQQQPMQQQQSNIKREGGE